jgi:hypothetical protein
MPPTAGVPDGCQVLQDTAITDTAVEIMNHVLVRKVNGSRYLGEIFNKITNLTSSFCFRPLQTSAISTDSHTIQYSNQYVSERASGAET